MRKNLRKADLLSSIQIRDGIFTNTIPETIKQILSNILTEDDPTEDNEYQRNVRKDINEYPQTEDDVDFTFLEVQSAFKNINTKKSPGIDKITGMKALNAFQAIP